MDGLIDPLLGRRRLGLIPRLRLLVEVGWTYGRVRWLLARHDVGWVVEALRAPADDDRLDHQTARRLGRRLARPIARTLEPLPWDSRCLVRSLVLLAMMARRGARCDLLIGARPGTEFAAHAWVEHAGQPMLPSLGYPPLTMI